MSKQIVTWIIIMMGVACTMSGCSIARDVVRGSEVAPVGDEIPVMTFDDELVQVAHQLPGFGGMFFDADGMLNIYLIDASRGKGEQTREEQHDRIKEALIAAFGQDNLNQHLQVGAGAVGQDNPPTPAGMQILEGTYDITQLAAWRPAVNRTLALPGVVLTDMDESKNRLRIGIDSPEHRQQVEMELKNQGIPLEAVLIEPADRTYLMQSPPSSQDSRRLIAGGLRIESVDNRFCTLGFSATREADASRGFVTALHCTGIGAKKAPMRFFQDGVQGRAHYIGVAQNNGPHYFTSSPQQNHRCQPPTRRCRYSDSIFVRYAQEAPVEYGRIARPTHASGSIEIDPANPVFWVTDTGPIAIAGQRLHKVGASTGWTFGRVTHTCIDVPAFYLDDSDAGITLLCQKRIATTDDNLIIGPGDSGAPVFAWRHQQVSQIDLFGLAWGGNSDGSQLTFSPIRSIEGELGRLSLQATSDSSFRLPGVPSQ